jgi:hypothetical protein
MRLPFLLVLAVAMTTPLQELKAAPLDVRDRVLAQLSDAELAALEKQDEPLGAFVERVSPKYSAPSTCSRWSTCSRRRATRRVEAVVHAPPRHTKTETILHAIAQMVSLEPAADQRVRDLRAGPRAQQEPQGAHARPGRRRRARRGRAAPRRSGAPTRAEACSRPASAARSPATASTAC